jgi:hypothetical protein
MSFKELTAAERAAIRQALGNKKLMLITLSNISSEKREAALEYRNKALAQKLLKNQQDIIAKLL